MFSYIMHYVLDFFFDRYIFFIRFSSVFYIIKIILSTMYLHLTYVLFPLIYIIFFDRIFRTKNSAPVSSVALKSIHHDL